MAQREVQGQAGEAEEEYRYACRTCGEKAPFYAECRSTTSQFYPYCTEHLTCDPGHVTLRRNHFGVIRALCLHEQRLLFHQKTVNREVGLRGAFRLKPGERTVTRDLKNYLDFCYDCENADPDTDGEYERKLEEMTERAKEEDEDKGKEADESDPFAVMRD